MDLPSFSFDLSALKQPSRPDPSETYDVLILGGGPAALSAAVYLARKMLRFALITKDFGGQMSDTSEIENYIGFQTISGQELVNRFVEHVKKFDTPVARDEFVIEVKNEHGLFQVHLQSGGVFQSKCVIVATGKRHRQLNVPGEKELVGKGVAYCAICDAPFFKNKKVVVAGGGNSALTAALDLLKVNAEVTLVNFVKGWQADPVMLQAVQKHSRATLLDYHAVMGIEGEARVTAVRVKDRESSEEKTILSDGIFVEIGLSPNTEAVRKLAKLSPSGELIVDCHCRTSVEGLFGAGDVSTVPYNQIVISAGEGAKAALAAYDYLLKKGLI